jgi:hypothetical protein
MRCTPNTREFCNSIRSPDTPERAQWLEVAQFQTEDRAQQFREDFMSLVGTDELGNIRACAGRGNRRRPKMDSQWQTMDKPSLEQLKAGEWTVAHPEDAWRPRLEEVPSNHAVEAANLDIDP